MTASEARRIIHPDTTIEALAEIEYYGGFNGKAAKKAAVDEACLVACAALDKQIPKKPDNFVRLKNLSTGSWHSYCDKCGRTLDWEVNE